MARKKVTKKSTSKTKKEIISKKIELEIVQKQQVLGVRASDEEFKGKYCNVAVIKHTEREFLFDFLLSFDAHSVLSSRVITNPNHAKAIYEVLGENIKSYEKQFGKILTKSEAKTKGKKNKSL